MGPQPAGRERGFPYLSEPAYLVDVGGRSGDGAWYGDCPLAPEDTRPGSGTQLPSFRLRASSLGGLGPLTA
jgi:hypothetical protein